MNQFTADNIDQLAALPLENGRGWNITFQSGNAGMCHQLYVNGDLAQWTDDPGQRNFVVESADSPRQIAIAAVDADNRETDFSSLFQPPSWVQRISTARLPDYPDGARVLVLGKNASGQTNPFPLAWADYWPAWMVRQVPGFGVGAFGAVFGVDPDVLILSVPLATEGTHRLVLRTAYPDGRWADSEVLEVTVAPPPPPAESVSVVAFDPRTSTITLNIQ